MEQIVQYPDIFFTPEYQDLFKDTAFGGEPLYFRSAGMEYRFYKRPIGNTPYFDIISPYGYSGLIPIGNADIIYWGYDITFNLAFHQYCLENNIITEFARLHPFLHNHLYLDEWVKNGEVVYIDLTKSKSAIWKGLDKGCKSAIKKAEKDCVCTLANFALSDFQDIYSQTMLRQDASLDYFFDGMFFERLLGLPGIILGAFYNNKIISCISILAYGDYAHYFLAGSDFEYRSLNGNSLLLWEAIKWAKYHGYKIFNLGGGKDESHSSFKRSFSKTTMSFYTYRKIHNEEAYGMLCYDKGIVPGSVDYFPEYRYVER